jgi:hypothetical protein
VQRGNSEGEIVPDLPQTPDHSSIVGDLEGFCCRFLVLSPGLPLVLALWSLATHLHESFDAFPYLAITSPTKLARKE